MNDSVAHIVADYGFAVASNNSFNIVDSSANVLAAATTLVGSAHHVTVTDVIDVATAVKIDNANTASTFSLSDTVANLVANTGGVTTQATGVTATNAATAVQATALFAANGAAKFAVSDTAANIVANGAGYTHATAVTITGASSVANVHTIKSNVGLNVNGGYTLTDTGAALAAAATAEVAAAGVVNVTGTIDGATAATIFGKNAAATYDIVDTNLANLFTGTCSRPRLRQHTR